LSEVLTFGCRLNALESEIIGRHTAGLANTIILNTCAVTAEAERQCRRALAKARRDRPGADIVVTGCAATIDPARWAALPGVTRVVSNAEKLRSDSWLEPSPFGRGQGEGLGREQAAPRCPYPNPLPEGEGDRCRARALLDVQRGCDHACTFCIIPKGRGPSRSLLVADVIARARALVEAGTNEIVLTGVDLASYRDGEFRLGDLVRALLKAIPELPRLRLSSLDPAAIDPALWCALAEAPRLMPHLHLSVQAGADLILKRMRRRHTRGEALAAIARARALRPGLAIGADLIAGFPTETDALFDETLAFVEEAAIPYPHVFPYSERPGTPAARMPAVPPALRRERAARLRAAGDRIAAGFHAGFVGQTVRVIAERGERGHTDHFTPVRLRASHPQGAITRVPVLAADAAGLEAG